MNHPLSLDSFTLYQSSYSVGSNGKEVSVFSVVLNTGKYLPYIACALTGLGMLLQFLFIPALAFLSRALRKKECV